MLAAGGPGLGQPYGALEEDPIVAQQGDQRDRRAESREASRVSRSKASSGGLSRRLAMPAAGS